MMWCSTFRSTFPYWSLTKAALTPGHARVFTARFLRRRPGSIPQHLGFPAAHERYASRIARPEDDPRREIRDHAVSGLAPHDGLEISMHLISDERRYFRFTGYAPHRRMRLFVGDLGVLVRAE